jgi:hypothetical protein
MKKKTKTKQKYNEGVFNVFLFSIDFEKKKRKKS